MRLIKISITTFLLLSLFSQISLCPSNSKNHLFRSLATTTSGWNTSLSDTQRGEYKTMLDLKTSFTGSLSFLPTSFTPEKEDYWKNLNLIIGVFGIIAAFPFGFVVFYLIVRFVCKKCRGPEKVSQVTRVYRNISWILFGISGVTLMVILSIVLGYSNKAK